MYCLKLHLNIEIELTNVHGFLYFPLYSFCAYIVIGFHAISEQDNSFETCVFLFNMDAKSVCKCTSSLVIRSFVLMRLWKAVEFSFPKGEKQVELHTSVQKVHNDNKRYFGGVAILISRHRSHFTYRSQPEN